MKSSNPPDPPISVRVKSARSYLAQEVLLPVQEFIRTEVGSGVLLLSAAISALLWANSPWAASYFHLWETSITIDLGPLTVSKSLEHWVNEALMTIFFFVVALEVKRELVHGHLSDPRRAALPLIAALGGMVVPVILFLALNADGPGARGWGIPMATDIAFALGVLALLGKRIPLEMRVFLLTLAVVDDIGSILAIALFYSEQLSFHALAVAFLLVLLMIGARVAGVRRVHFYTLMGTLFWLAVLKSGIHATIAGVVLGGLTPASAYLSRRTFSEAAGSLINGFQQALTEGNENKAEALLGELGKLNRETEAPLERIERQVHPWSSSLILPIFALANSGIIISSDQIVQSFTSFVTQGILLGLVVGKCIGVSLACWISVRLGIASLPGKATWSHIVGTSLLAGIGFTVSLFIAGLAYRDSQVISDAKMGILCASLLSGMLGYAFLLITTRSQAILKPGE